MSKKETIEELQDLVNASDEDIAKDLQKLINDGLVKTIYKDGQTLYQLTEEGEKVAQEIAQADPNLN